MSQLLRIEWMKLKDYRAFKVFGILYLAGIVAVLFITNVIYDNIPSAELLKSFLQNPFTYPVLWNTTGWLNSWLLFFPGWLIINHCVNEFNFKTHRQNIIDGWSRKEFITAKLLLILAFAVVITVINIVAAIGMGFLLHAPFSFDGFQYMAFVFVQSLIYMLFAFMLAILLRRSGLAAGIFFLYGLIFEFMFTQLINRQFNLSPVGYFQPLQVSDQLVPFPFLKQNISVDAPGPIAFLIGCVVYCGLYVLGSVRKFTHDDL